MDDFIDMKLNMILQLCGSRWGREGGGAWRVPGGFPGPKLIPLKIKRKKKKNIMYVMKKERRSLIEAHTLLVVLYIYQLPEIVHCLFRIIYKQQNSTSFLEPFQKEKKKKTKDLCKTEAMFII